jgi:hypothetical protein
MELDTLISKKLDTQYILTARLENIYPPAVCGYIMQMKTGAPC